MQKTIVISEPGKCLALVTLDHFVFLGKEQIRHFYINKCFDCTNKGNKQSYILSSNSSETASVAEENMATFQSVF